MKYILVILSIVYSSASFAGIETDRDAGECGAYLMATSKKYKDIGANKAVQMADKEQRAINFGLAWIDKLKLYRDDKAMVNGMVYKAESACRRVGIRSSDYD